MINLLKNEDGFINIAKQGLVPVADECSFTLDNGIQINHLDIGVIEILPAKTTNKSIVLSCGIHGNETAPIELVSTLISQIVKGDIEPNVNLLCILGNPQSMKIADRFVSINLNRLFNGYFQNYEPNAENSYELKRAERLEEIVRDFYSLFSGTQKMHLDLHTAIKPSFHKTFAIRPFQPKATSDDSRRLLSALGIEAVLHSDKPSSTFSSYSVEKFSAEGYTLELGKVKKFGENDRNDFVKASNTIKSLITNQIQGIKETSHKDLIEYKIVAEIIRQSEAFIFNVADDVKNFTAFPQGFLIAEDEKYSYRVAHHEEAVVFPNANVPIGQRVAVMVTQIDS